MDTEVVQRSSPHNVPDATAIEKPRPYLGMVKLLRVENFDLVGEEFDVGFYFRENRLHKVTFELKNVLGRSSTVHVFNAVSEVLKAKYGAPVTHEVSPDPMIISKAQWVSGRTNIFLLAMESFAEGPPSLSLSYQNRIATEADKL